VNLLVERGDRIALVGPNGAGKSTLMRIFAGVDRPDGGARVLGHNAVVDYFAQNQAEVLNPARTVYEEMTSASPTTMVPMIRNILGGFLFSGDDVYKRVAVLSGGERNRLALAKMLLNASNLMILDEPTNHLDLDSKEVLLEALGDYGGTLIFVSHDRYFVDNLATKVVDVGGGKALLYPGGYEDFVYWKKQREAGVAVPLPSMRQAPAPSAKEAVRPEKATVSAPKPAAKAPEPPRAKGAPAPAYDPLKPRLRPADPAADQKAREKDARKAKARLAELERAIGEKEHRVKELETLMASPGFYDDRAKAERAVGERQQVLDEVNALMGEWESLQAAVEVKG
jgi:ATP-binding cassette subfamily F protein 3